MGIIKSARRKQESTAWDLNLDEGGKIVSKQLDVTPLTE